MKLWTASAERSGDGALVAQSKSYSVWKQCRASPATAVHTILLRLTWIRVHLCPSVV